MVDEEITQLKIGTYQVGIIGLKEAVTEFASSLAKAPDEEIAGELIRRLSKKNYIPEKSRPDYARALVREFRRQLGQPVQEEKPTGLVIKVLGQGCNSCRELTQRIMDIMSELNLAADLEHVTDIKEIGRYRVMGIPALIINGKILSVGSVPSKKRLTDWLKQAKA
jgi:hypothetical protein